MHDAYQQAGLNLHPETTPTRIDKQPDGTLSITAETKGQGEVTLEGFDTILMATGRKPKTSNIGLEKVSIHYICTDACSIGPILCQLISASAHCCRCSCQSYAVKRLASAARHLGYIL